MIAADRHSRRSFVPLTSRRWRAPETTAAERSPWPILSAFALVWCLLWLVPTALAEAPPRTQPYREWVPPEMRDIGVEEKAGQTLPLDLKFYNESGRPVALREFFDNTRPVILQLGYFECPQLCGKITQGMVHSLKQQTLDLGTDFRLLYISFDPAETYHLAASKKQAMLQAYGRPGAASGLHLLTGEKKSILELTQAVGYKFRYVESQRQYAHPAVIMLFTPDGRLSRYLYGLEFDPRTLRLSLVEASEGKIGTTVDRIMLTCLMYDGSLGRYGPRVARLVMKAGGAISVVILASTLGFLYYREHRRRRQSTGGEVNDR
ncbi:MAG: SCO family protein [Phycisphaerae bacterium]|nr:SCO family protein [Phycisphaerae bacterium]MDW8262033.1 SCO family protein [Phycisphaerales bacterium]